MPGGLGMTIHMVAAIIEFGGSVFVVTGCLRGLFSLVASRGGHAGIVRTRLLVADGVIAALGFKTAATLLNTIELQTWDAILSFAAIFALRTLVKRALVWEERRLEDAAPQMPASVARAM